MTVSVACYCTRESVKRALDSKETARNDAQIDDAVQAAVESVFELTNRDFVPRIETRRYDWPNRGYAPSWRLWVPTRDLISVTTFTSGGVTVSASDFDLRNGDDRAQAPYDRVEIDLSSDAGLDSGFSHQGSQVLTGLWGYRDDRVAAGAVVEALDTTETGVDVNAACSAACGVGDLILVDSERMLVTSRTALDTGQVCTDLTAQNNSVTITGVTAGTVASGETILVDSERMLVVDVAGTTLTVKRAFDGSTLAAHTGSPHIWAYQTLNVVRGFAGTTAAAHNTSTAVYRTGYPALVSQLALAESLSSLLNQASGYARTAGSGDNEREIMGRSLQDLRDRAESRYGLKVMTGAI